MAAKADPVPLPAFMFAVANDIADSFVESLASPSAPAHCALFYASCLDSFCGEQAHAYIRTNRHDVCTATMRFLTHPRTQEELTLLTHTLSTCQCTRKHAALDTTWRTMHPELENPQFFTVLLLCMRFISKCLIKDPGRSFKLASLDDARRMTNKAEKRGEKVLWPEKTNDIFVNSPEITLSMLWRIFNTHDRWMPVLAFINTLVHVSGSTLSSLFPTIPSFAGDLLDIMEAEIGCLSRAQPDLFNLGTVAVTLHEAGAKPLRTRNANAFLYWAPHARRVLELTTQALDVLSSLSPPPPHLLSARGLYHGLAIDFLYDYYEQVSPFHREYNSSVVQECRTLVQQLNGDRL